MKSIKIITIMASVLVAAMLIGQEVAPTQTLGTAFPYEKAKQVATSSLLEEISDLTPTATVIIIGCYEERADKIIMYLEAEFKQTIGGRTATYVAQRKREFIRLKTETGYKWLMTSRTGPKEDFVVVE